MVLSAAANVTVRAEEEEEVGLCDAERRGRALLLVSVAVAVDAAACANVGPQREDVGGWTAEAGAGFGLAHALFTGVSGGNASDAAAGGRVVIARRSGA